MRRQTANVCAGKNMNACKLSTAVQQSKRHSPAKVIKIVHARINVNTASNSVGI